MKRVGYLVGPMITVTLSQYFLQIISMVMVGHLGKLALSSTAIAISLCAVSGFSLIVSVFLPHLTSLTKYIKIQKKSPDYKDYSKCPEIQG